MALITLAMASNSIAMVIITIAIVIDTLLGVGAACAGLILTARTEFRVTLRTPGFIRRVFTHFG
jgi:hypothetical protein